MAFHLAGDPNFDDDLPPFQPDKLYLHVFPKKALRLGVKLMPLFGVDPRRFGRNHDVDLVSLVEEGDFPVHSVIDYGEVEEKRAAAAACHASQLEGGPPSRGPLAWILRRMGHTEHFMRFYPEMQGSKTERDLFA
jgi:N-acetyl-1-D-myo-inositol-2-amino-2-deoxy-alpha-D-glucopyranoside deacetylase/mycothiol S-conjugate amidase